MFFVFLITGAEPSSQLIQLDSIPQEPQGIFKKYNKKDSRLKGLLRTIDFKKIEKKLTLNNQCLKSTNEIYLPPSVHTSLS